MTHKGTRGFLWGFSHRRSDWSFDSDRRAMAHALRRKPAELEQALSRPGAYRVALFERLVVHCLSNGLSVDALPRCRTRE